MRFRYILKESFLGLWKNLTMVISVIIVTAVSLTFVGFGLVMQKQISEMRAALVQNAQISIYMCSPHSTALSCASGAATQTQIDEVEAALNGDILGGYISNVYRRSQDEALQIYQQQFAGESFAQDFTAADLPVSFHLTLHDPANASAVVDFFKGRTGVDEVSDLLAVYAPLITILNQSSVLAISLAVIMLVAAVLLIATTIRMSVSNRKKEIGIMRLVGASNLFIRMPFLLEGAVAAAIGAVLASGFLFIGLKFLVEGWILPALGRELVKMGVVDLVWAAPILLLIGIFLAVGSSVVSLNRYLKV